MGVILLRGLKRQWPNWEAGWAPALGTDLEMVLKWHVFAILGANLFFPDVGDLFLPFPLLSSAHPHALQRKALPRAPGLIVTL